jgi:hypothetical protein
MYDSFQDMKPFKVPSSVPWPAMANLLNVKFKAETGRGLSELSEQQSTDIHVAPLRNIILISNQSVFALSP